MKKVLIKGAGDLATGIACRLHRCGYQVVMTEIAVPTTVRRTVAFSRAVYEEKAVVEDITGILCHSTEDVYKRQLLNRYGIPVKSTSRHSLAPYFGEPLVKAFSNYRRYSKSLSSFLHPIPALIHPADGRLHPQLSLIHI